jgi:hypothetical protein
MGSVVILFKYFFPGEHGAVRQCLALKGPQWRILLHNRPLFDDTVHMRISSGMAEIGFNPVQGSRIASEQFYVWPLYNAGRVESIRGVTRRTESNVIYSKPSLQDREKILELAKERSFNEYSPSGRIGRPHAGLQPGSLFDAIV